MNAEKKGRLKRSWGSHKQTSRSYWKADTSNLVNPSFPHRDRFHKWDLHGFLFSKLLSLHSSSKMVEETRVAIRWWKK